KAAEGRARSRSRRQMAHVAVDGERVGPIGLDGDEAEAVPLDQPAGDGGASAVEFRRAVARLAEQHQPAVGIAVELGGEFRIVETWQRLGGGTEELRQAGGWPARWRLARLVVGPALLADQRHETNFLELLAMKGTGAGPRQPDQGLHAPGLADRHHQPAADRELLAQGVGNARSAGSGDDGIERRLL